MESFQLFCEKLLLEEFESILEYDTKDARRINDFFKKSGGDMTKVISLANQMAKSITKPDKAYNRAKAAIDVMKTGDAPNPVADIFYARANELGYDPDKIPVEIPKSPKVAKLEEPEDKKPSAPKQPRAPKVTHTPQTKPASLLPSSEQFSSTRNPKTVPGPQGAGTPIEYIGMLTVDTGKCAGVDLYEIENGTVEVWKLNDDSSVFIFGVDDTPSVSLETPCGFLDALNGNKYLFYGELVDYIASQDMSALIDLYGNKIRAYKYED